MRPNPMPQPSVAFSKSDGALLLVSLLRSSPAPLHLVVISIQPSPSASQSGRVSPGEKFPIIYSRRSLEHSWQECCSWACTGTSFRDGAFQSISEFASQHRLLEPSGPDAAEILFIHSGAWLHGSMLIDTCVGRRFRNSRPRPWLLGSH